MKQFLTTIILLISIAVNAQNVIIDYEAWNPSNPTCNILATAINIPATIGSTNGNIEHQTKLGQPSYSSTDKAIQMATEYQYQTPPTPSIYKGTRYRIAYSFKAGYSYVITVKMAATINTSGSSTGPYLRLDVNNNSGGGGTACAGPASLSYDLGGNPAAKQVSSTSFSDFQFGPFYSPNNSNHPTMEITAIPAENGATNTIRIRKITIVETAPPPVTPVFNITPSTINITCGTPITQTFTVNNVNNTAGVSYEWNLGSANNGWLYQGSAAPQVIQTTGNSITLTAASGCAVPSNVVGIAKVGGTNYANTSSPNIILPTMDIVSNTGNVNICSGTSQIYSISNLPCAATVNWAVSPAGIVDAVTSGNTVTLTPIGTGVVTLDATISNACGASVVKSTQLNIGVPAVWADIQDQGSNSCYQQNNMYYFTVANPDPLVQYKWGYYPPSGNLYMDPGAVGVPSTSFSFNQEGYYAIIAVPYNGCGDGAYSEFNLYVNPFWQSCNSYRLSVAPNPIQEEFTVSISDESQEVKSLSKEENIEIYLYDFNTRQIVKKWFFKNNQNNFKLNVQGMRKGKYMVQVRKSKFTQVKQIIVQ